MAARRPLFLRFYPKWDKSGISQLPRFLVSDEAGNKFPKKTYPGIRYALLDRAPCPRVKRAAQLSQCARPLRRASWICLILGYTLWLAHLENLESRESRNLENHSCLESPEMGFTSLHLGPIGLETRLRSTTFQGTSRDLDLGPTSTSRDVTMRHYSSKDDRYAYYGRHISSNEIEISILVQHWRLGYICSVPIFCSTT